MKKILFLLLAVMFSCVSFAVTKVNLINIEGIYTTSAYPGTYTLLGDNYFPKKSCIVGVQLHTLPNGYHYEWEILSGESDGHIQVQPGTDFAYIDQNGNNDRLDFSISVIDESTGYPVNSREIRFVFVEGFTKPVPPPID